LDQKKQIGSKKASKKHAVEKKEAQKEKVGEDA
jgi:hypothetical protein